MRVVGLLPLLFFAGVIGAAHGQERAASAEVAALSPPVRAFAVVVGSVRADRPELSTLRYADDDAARWYETLSLFAEVELLVTLDPETQERHPGLADKARTPTLEELSGALARTREKVTRAKAAGDRTAFYFVFAGHGDATETNEGYLVLHDGRFTRTDLYRDVISSPADATHVILDACRAYFMVAKRGSGTAAAIRDVLDVESLQRWPNVGVIVATTASAEVHEWSRWSAGVFSHEVRSAFLGGADLDGDGAVSYLETGAFLAAANAKVSDPRAKLSVTAIPPRANHGAALVDWRGAKDVAFLRIGTARPEAMVIEDARGVRIADLNFSSAKLALALPPGREYHVRGKGWETSFTPRSGESIDLSGLVRGAPALSARGSVGAAFERGLFAVPFDHGFYAGWVAANPRGAFPEAPRLPARSRWRRPAAWSGAGLALASGGGAAWSWSQARTDAARYREAFGTGPEVAKLRRSAERRERDALVLGGLSLASAGASGWLFWSEHHRAAVAFEPGTGGGRISVVVAFGGAP